MINYLLKLPTADNRAFEKANVTTGAAIVHLQDKERIARQNYVT